MSEFMQNSVFWGVALSFVAYGIGMLLQRKFHRAIFNPLLISVILIMVFLGVSGTDYRKYQEGANVISYFLTPATVCLAIPLYEQIELLKKNFRAIMVGILSGVLTSLCSVLAMSVFFGLNHKEYATLLPKSITTAIGMGVSEELGGYVTLTVAIIIITGILGSVLAETACRIFKITEPVARGVAIGTACDRYLQGNGNGRDGRGDFRLVDCGCRSFDGCGSVRIFLLFIKKGCTASLLLFEGESFIIRKSVCNRYTSNVSKSVEMRSAYGEEADKKYRYICTGAGGNLSSGLCGITTKEKETFPGNAWSLVWSVSCYYHINRYILLPF